MAAVTHTPGPWSKTALRALVVSSFPPRARGLEGEGWKAGAVPRNYTGKVIERCERKGCERGEVMLNVSLGTLTEIVRWLQKGNAIRVTAWPEGVHQDFFPPHCCDDEARAAVAKCERPAP